MLSIGALTSAAQGASYYERDGYYAKDDPEHRAASGWFGKGAEDLGLKGPVDPEVFRAGPGGQGAGRLGHRARAPGQGRRNPPPSRPRPHLLRAEIGLLAALVGGDARIVEAHDRAVKATLAWVEKNVAETRMKDPVTGQMVRAGDQKIVAATFRHDTSRNLDPQLHTHAVVANMVRGEDDKWRSMANEKLYGSKMLLGALYRSELAASLTRLGYDIEKTHADGRFEIAGVSRDTIEAFSTRRAEIEAAMAERGLGTSGDNPRLAERASLMTRAKKRDIDRGELRGVWERQAADLGLDARALVAEAAGKSAVPVREAAAEPATGPDRAGEMAAPALDDIRAYSNRALLRLRTHRHRKGELAGIRDKCRSARDSCRKHRRHRPRRRPWPGRWRISRSARPCSPAPISSPPRSPMRRARSPSRRPNARSRPWRRRGPCTA